jgi:hypothetical protein
MNIKMPQTTQGEKSFFSRLFASDKADVSDVVLKFKAKDKATDVIVSTANDQVLNAEQKKSVFQKMGILE